MSIHGVAKGPPTTNPPSAPQSEASAGKSVKLSELPFRDGNVTISRSVDGTPVASPPASVRSTGEGTWEVRTADGEVYVVSAEEETAAAGPPTTNPQAAAGPPTTNPQAAASGPPTTNPSTAS